MAILMLLSIFLQQPIRTGVTAFTTVAAALNTDPRSDQGKESTGDNPGADLRMAAVVTSIRACTDERSLTARVKLYLRITYTNAGTYPLLLHRENSKVIGGYRIASSRESLAAKKYETSGSPYILSSGPQPDLIAFKNVKPGRAFSTEASTEVMIPVDVQDQARILDGQTHYLQVWPLDEDDPLHVGNNHEKLRARWIKQGYLWTGRVVSSPIEITMPTLNGMRKCR